MIFKAGKENDVLERTRAPSRTSSANGIRLGVLMHHVMPYPSRCAEEQKDVAPLRQHALPKASKEREAIHQDRFSTIMSIGQSAEVAE